MNKTIRAKGLPLPTIVVLLLLLTPGLSFAGKDMWSGVFDYQQKMANYGNPEAQVKLGEMYEEGHGTEQDYGKAEQWYIKAAAQGYAPAQKKLNQLDQRRKREAEAKKLAEQERIAREKQEKQQAAEAARQRAEQERLAREAEAKQKADKAKQQAEAVARQNAEEQAAKQAEEKKAAEELAAKDEAERAKQEAEARKRAQEAMKKMMATPSAYSEE